MKIQSVKVPFAPFQSRAPPFWKLKFHENKKKPNKIIFLILKYLRPKLMLENILLIILEK